MIKVTYDSSGIRIDIGEVSKYNNNLPLRVNIIKSLSGEFQWGTELNDGWFATFPNTEMFDVEILDSKGVPIYYKRWDVMEHGTDFYKSLWIYCKKLISNGKIPKGLAIGTHDGEFGEWVPVVKNKLSEVLLVEGSQTQYDRLVQNYSKNSLVKTRKEIVTPDGKDVIFFEGGEGYTNSVVEKVIRKWETEEIKSTFSPSISINNLILENFKGGLDWIHLDVEGLDAKLIMAIDNLPNFIIFEDDNLPEDEKDEIYGYLMNRNYSIKSFGGICEAVKI
jgi:hypothetical protein